MKEKYTEGLEDSVSPQGNLRSKELLSKGEVLYCVFQPWWSADTVNQNEMTFNGTHKHLVYAGYVNLFGEHINNVSSQKLLQVSKEFGLKHREN